MITITDNSYRTVLTLRQDDITVTIPYDKTRKTLYLDMDVDWMKSRLLDEYLGKPDDIFDWFLAGDTSLLCKRLTKAVNEGFKVTVTYLDNTNVQISKRNIESIPGIIARYEDLSMIEAVCIKNNIYIKLEVHINEAAEIETKISCDNNAFISIDEVSAIINSVNATLSEIIKAIGENNA